MDDLSAGELQELQANELAALEAIYMQDFERVESASVWKITAPAPEFRLTLRPLETDLQAQVHAVLHVRFPKLYPRKPPIVALDSHQGLEPAQVHDLQGQIADAVIASTGGEMVFELATLVQEFITAHHAPLKPPSAGAIVPSESAHHAMVQRAERIRQAELAREAEERQRLLLQENEARFHADRELEQRILQDLDLKRALIWKERQKQQRFVAPPALAPNPTTLAETGPLASLSHYLALTTTDGQSPGGWRPLIVLSTPAHLGPDDSLASSFRTLVCSPALPFAGIGSLSTSVLRSVPTAVGPGLATTGLSLCVLMESIGNGITLSHALQSCGPLVWSQAKYYVKQLLYSLVYIHSNGFVHKAIDMNLQFPFALGGTASVSQSATGAPTYNKKCDVFDLGLVVLDMVLGLETRSDNTPVEDRYQRLVPLVPPSMAQVVHKMLTRDRRQQPTALELLADPFFRETTEENVERIPALYLLGGSSGQWTMETGSASGTHTPDSRLGKPDTVGLELPSPSRALGILTSPMMAPTSATAITSSSYNKHTLSRYRSDFEEIEFLGKGGYGEVVKARNKLDDRFYAVKKIKLDPRDVETNRKILREVTTLSRLHHEYVVRYYTTWFEDANGEWGNHASSSEDGLGGSSDSRLFESGSDFESDASSASDILTNSAFHNDLLFVDESHSKSIPGIHFGRIGGEYNRSTRSRRRVHSASSSSASTPVSPAPTVSTTPSLFSADILSERRSSGTGRASASPRMIQRGARGTLRSAKDAGNMASPARNSMRRDYRILYIQMEYCEKNTLRDAIDLGLSLDECWRLFRQILEGLVYIHAQGMIHRDLKPSNVFLDANGDVKIGDFGLATSNQTQINASTIRSRHASLDRDPEDSMTSDIGTTLYVAPEVTQSLKGGGSRYNQKVDMYSLGIIFFEMCYPLQTGMERVKVLHDLRRAEVVFPSEFPDHHLANQRRIIEWLLKHNPRDRPTSLELFQSDYLPPRMEDDYIQECVRTIANPNTPYYNRLMSALFDQFPERPKDFTYDFYSDVADLEHTNSVYYDRVHDYLSRIFRRHGAVEVCTPLLMPRLDIYDQFQKPVHVMDPTGTLVQLPYDLTLPFARYVARNKIQELKRFSFDKIYKENPVGGQPRQVYEVDFDSVWAHPNNPIGGAEVFKIVDEIFEDLPIYAHKPLIFLVNHSCLLDTIFDHLRIPEDLRRPCCSFLRQLGVSLSMVQVRQNLMAHLDLPRHVLDTLERFNIQGDLATLRKLFQTLIPADATRLTARWQDALEDLGRLELALNPFTLKHRWTYCPLLVNNYYYYKDHFFFQFVVDNKKREVLATGGRYDKLVQFFQAPTTLSKGGVAAAGVNIAIQKVIFEIANYQSTFLRSLSRSKHDTVPPSFGLWA
ncbi:kinase-like domain-containing protein, partial [Dimargaris cristalligena]